MCRKLAPFLESVAVPLRRRGRAPSTTLQDEWRASAPVHRGRNVVLLSIDPFEAVAGGACTQQPRFNVLTLSAPVRGEFREILMTETRRSGFSVFYVCPPDVGAFPRRSQFGGEP
jgi:hypothetical protein